MAPGGCVTEAMSGQQATLDHFCVVPCSLPGTAAPCKTYINVPETGQPPAPATHTEASWYLHCAGIQLGDVTQLRGEDSPLRSNQE